MKKRSKAGGEPIKGRRRKRRSRTQQCAEGRNTFQFAFSREETKVARLTRELNEASERHAATSEVLQVIGSSPAT